MNDQPNRAPIGPLTYHSDVKERRDGWRVIVSERNALGHDGRVYVSPDGEALDNRAQALKFAKSVEIEMRQTVRPI